MCAGYKPWQKVNGAAEKPEKMLKVTIPFSKIRLLIDWLRGRKGVEK